MRTRRFVNHTHYIGFSSLWKESWKSGLVSMLAFTLVSMGFLGVSAKIGLGHGGEFLLAAVVGAALISLTEGLTTLIVFLLTKIPRLFVTLLLGCMVIWLMILMPIGSFPLALWISLLVLMVWFVLGVSVFVLFNHGFRPIWIVLLILTASLNIGGLFWLSSEGYLPPHSSSVAPSIVENPPIPSPAIPGSYPVSSLLYGSGSDERRSEYNMQVQLITPSVDATPFLPKGSKFQQKARAWFWGFGPDHFPLNGRTWYPSSEEDSGPFPLVLIVHGNHQMEEFSDPGYEYLGTLLASQGYITVSVDENFLNGSWSGNIQNENDARAWILLKHLELWQQWNLDPDNPFYQRVDLGNIALIGHSRGGEAVAIAGAFSKLKYYPDDALIPFDFGFNIKSIIAISPSSDQYQPANQLVKLSNLNYLTIHGSYDSDVTRFMGQAQYQRVHFTDGNPWLKASVYVKDANHGQFNTVWGREDLPVPAGLLLNTKPIMDPQVQREIGSVYIAAFLDLTLRNNHQYRSLFTQPNEINQWIAGVKVLLQYKDPRFQVLADFSEDIDVTTASVSGVRIHAENLSTWKETNLSFSQDYHTDGQAVLLEWDTPTANFQIHFQEPGSLVNDEPTTALYFVIASGVDDKTIDFSVQLMDASGTQVTLPFSAFDVIPPQFTRIYTKWSLVEKTRYPNKESEPVLQTYYLPWTAFAAGNRDFDFESLTEICLLFDQTPEGSIYVGEIGMLRKQTAEPVDYHNNRGI